MVRKLDAPRHQEFLIFLRQVTRAYPGVQLHLIMDNDAAHNTPPSATSSPPTHASTCTSPPPTPPWMNMVEVWFCIAERQAIHRGSYRWVQELTTTIPTFINGRNDRAHPFILTRPVDEILAKPKRPDTSHTAH